MSNERTTDQFVRDMLRDIGFKRPWEQSCNDAPKYIYDALEGASKGPGNGRGKPEFVVESSSFLIVIEDKGKFEHSLFVLDGEIVVKANERLTYALNGAVHYARFLAERTQKQVFAVGVAGTEAHHEITVAFVEKGTPPHLLAKVDSLIDLSAENIDEYHRVAVKGELPASEIEVREVRKVAAGLHEDMRNYASLEGERKAALVSAILLALKYQPELIGDMNGDKKTGYSDGEKVFKAASEYLGSEEADLKGSQKLGILLDQFRFIKEHVLLNRVDKNLGGVTPIKRFVEVLNKDVIHAVSDASQSDFDVLGNFYGEFVKYSGSDGNSLGIVLTPHHITNLMAELINIDADDIVIDPCAGTAAFLISAMQRMFNDAENRFGKDPEELKKKRDNIKSKQLHGIELQDKLFAIGTTNMILRGDGKANFQRHSMFDLSPEDLRGEHGFTKALINPPYSQSKTGETRHLSELSFIERTLSFLDHKGRMAVIVPQSAMVGKTREDKILKAKILANHTLDAVITMNPDTFYGVGTHVVIALFTAGIAHPASKKTTFIDFKNDGYKVRQHLGLLGDGNEKSHRAHLMSVLNDGEHDETSYVVRSEVTAADEWQHSYFYFNDQPPSYEDFMKTVADYVTWQIDMHAHGKGNLLTNSEDVETRESKRIPSSQRQIQMTDSDELPDLKFQPLLITDVVSTMKASSAQYDKSKLDESGEKIYPYVSRTKSTNGIDDYCSYQEKPPEDGNAITIGLDTQTVAYQPTRFYTSQNIQVLHHDRLTPDSGLVIASLIKKQMDKFNWGGNGATLGRLRRTQIMVPVITDANGEKSVDWDGMAGYGRALRVRVENAIWPVLTP